MKDQSQDPMAPSTYYPSWQTDAAATHHQGWTNQFMQHIPHTSSAAPMDFGTPQTYPYSAAPSAGSSAQNGLIFDPNYSRSYATAPADNYATNALTGLANVGYANDEPARNGEPYGSAAVAAAGSGGASVAAVSKSAEPLASVDGEGSVANHHLPADSNNSRTMSPNNNTNQLSSYEAGPVNNHPPAGAGAAPPSASHNGSEWDWSGGGGEKMYQPHKSKGSEDHSMGANDYNSIYYSHNQNASALDQHHQAGIKKESHSPTKSDSAKGQNQFEAYHQQQQGLNAEDTSLKMGDGGKHKDPSSRHERNFLASESQKYPPFNHHQSYFNVYYPSSAYGMEHASSKYHSVLPPPPPPPPHHHPHHHPPATATYSHHHHYPEQQQDNPQQQQQHQAFGKDKKVYHHDEGGGAATSANSLLATNESEESSSKNNANSSTYDKSRKESKLYQPQLNLHNDNRDGGGGAMGPTKDGNNLSAPTNGESGAAAAKGESYGAKHHHQQQQQQQSNRLLMSSIKEEPIDGYYQQQQQQHHQQQQQHNQNSTPDPRDYQQSKLYQPQNGYYPMYDLNGVEDTTPHPVSCPTNFEKEIPYHVSGRMNGALEDMSHYGKLPNGIKSEPMAQDYNSDGGLNSDQQFYNGVTEDKKVEPIEMAVEKHPSPPETPIDRTEKAQKPEVPDCDCFSAEKTSPEPGSYYTHLGSATSLAELRTDFETRFNIHGRQLRIEKVMYTGKEGKTGQGCPLAKWIIRRTDQEEKVLCIVKKRQGHRCSATFLIICIVVWDGIPKHEADDVYKLLIHKLNKFGLPTTRRCATNENRTCACQGLDPETSGASYSFGCSWSMYYNGCKYARSKTVRKFRLSVKSEEAEIEERMNYLASMLAPLYERATPKAYENQCKYEQEAPDCRLGFHNGKPFSGVTASMDFCAHAHRDLHNMQDGCTVQVALLRNRHPSEEVDEQLHILPLYVMDTTDESGSADAQKEKNNTGGVHTLEKFPCEVRIRSTPLQPCRRHGKKRPGKEGEEEAPPPSQPAATTASSKKDSNSKSSKGSKSSTAKNESNSSNNSKSPGASQSPRSQTPSTTTIPAAAAGAAAVQNNSGNSAFAAPNSQYPATGNPTGPENGAAGSGVNANGGGPVNPNSNLVNMASMINNFTEAQLQSNQISSTVLDSPYTYDYNTGSYVDSRHNYYNHHHPAAAVHHTHPHHAQPPAVAQPPAPHHPQWPDFNNNNNSNNNGTGSGTNNPGAPATAFDTATAAGTIPLGLKHRGGLEENPDSTGINQNAYNNGFATAGTEAPKANPPEVDYFKPKTEYQTQSHHHATNQSSYSMYPPPPPSHHPHHHHPGFGDHQAAAAYQQNYDYRYNYSPYANQAFHHHPYSGMYSPSAYSGAHGWNAMYQTSPAANPTTAVLPASPHIPVSGNSSGAPFGYSNQMLPLASSPGLPPTVIKSEPVPKVEPIGEVQEVNDNLEAFQDSQMGGIGIALGHGSVLFECAKHEMHATTALRKPNRTLPNRIALIFYQHRNLNRPKHGTEEWEEKMRLKKSNQEVENKLLKSIKQEGGVAPENNGPPAVSGGSTNTASTSTSKKGSKSSKTEQNVTTAAPEMDIKPDLSSALHTPPHQPPSSLGVQLPPAPLSVAPTWPGNFAMGYPMSSPYHHPHANTQFHHHHQYQAAAAAHHHMMGPISKTSHIGSPTKSLST